MARYFKYKNIKKTEKNAAWEQYKSLTKREKKCALRKNFLERAAVTLAVIVLVGGFVGCIKLITIIPVPEAVGFKILYIAGVGVLGILSFILCAVFSCFMAFPFVKLAGKYDLPAVKNAVKKEILSSACAHLREYYGLQEPCLVTKCYHSSDENFVNHDVCLFFVGDELRITADLKQGFLHGERDLGCYAFDLKEITLSKTEGERFLIAELKTENVVFLLGYRAKSFIMKKGVNSFHPAV